MYFDTNIGRNFVRVYAENVVVICHGLPYEPASVVAKGYDELAEFFASRGLNSVIFDFSGTGLSKGEFRIANWVEDLLNLVERFKSVHLVAFSMGGVPATFVAQLDNVKSLTLLATPCSIEMVRKDLLEKAYANAKLKGSLKGIGDFEEFMSSFKRDLEEFEPIKWIGNVRKPKLFVHGTNDDIIPFESSERMFEKAGEPKYFVKVAGGDHYLRRNRKVMEIVAEWIAKNYAKGEFKGKIVEVS
jgi:alpha-beta hydrolase superfamily lysophospholipase